MTTLAVKKVTATTTKYDCHVTVYTTCGRVFEMSETPHGTSVRKIGAEKVAQNIRAAGTFNINNAQIERL